jgi:hypothetical protein
VTGRRCLLVLTHSRTGSTAVLADAVTAGAVGAVAELGRGGDAGAPPAASATGEEGIVQGTPEAAVDRPLEVVRLDVSDAGLDDVLVAGGVVFCTPARFGALAGLTKDLLERIYPWFEEVPDVRPGMPWTAVVKGATDPSGAVRDLERILTGLRWKQVLPPVQVVGTLSDADLAAASEVGATMAAGLVTGIW